VLLAQPSRSAFAGFGSGLPTSSKSRQAQVSAQSMSSSQPIQRSYSTYGRSSWNAVVTVAAAAYLNSEVKGAHEQVGTSLVIACAVVDAITPSIHNLFH
jgi:hypothetical protein